MKLLKMRLSRTISIRKPSVLAAEPCLSLSDVHLLNGFLGFRGGASYVARYSKTTSLYECGIIVVVNLCPCRVLDSGTS